MVLSGHTTNRYPARGLKRGKQALAAEHGMQRSSLAIGNDQRRFSEQAAVAWDVPFACDKGSGEG